MGIARAGGGETETEAYALFGAVPCESHGARRFPASVVLSPRPGRSQQFQSISRPVPGLLPPCRGRQLNALAIRRHRRLPPPFELRSMSDIEPGHRRRLGLAPSLGVLVLSDLI